MDFSGKCSRVLNSCMANLSTHDPIDTISQKDTPFGDNRRVNDPLTRKILWWNIDGNSNNMAFVHHYSSLNRLDRSLLLSQGLRSGLQDRRNWAVSNCGNDHRVWRWFLSLIINEGESFCLSDDSTCIMEHVSVHEQVSDDDEEEMGRNKVSKVHKWMLCLMILCLRVVRIKDPRKTTIWNEKV
jgi:hypothetical protein